MNLGVEYFNNMIIFFENENKKDLIITYKWLIYVLYKNIFINKIQYIFILYKIYMSEF